jgi:MinD superfamily P-loop ATPase
MSTDRSDVEGTQRMIAELYEIFNKKTGIIMNKVPSELHSVYSKKLEIHHLPILGVVSCSCDILGAAGRCLFACEKLDHPFTEKLREIAARIECLATVDKECSMSTFPFSAHMPSATNQK